MTENRKKGFSFKALILTLSLSTIFFSIPVNAQPLAPDKTELSITKFSVASTSAYSQAKSFVDERSKFEYEDEMFFVKYQPGTTYDQKLTIHSKVQEGLKTDQLISSKASFSEDTDLIKNPIPGNKKAAEELMTLYKLNPEVIDVVPNYVYKSTAWTVTGTTAKPGDYNNTTHWNHEITNLPELFKAEGCGTVNDDLCGGRDQVVIAILDSGLAFEDQTLNYDIDGYAVTPDFDVSPQFDPSILWTNPGEDYGGGDEDHNEVCDDVHGADWIQYEDNYFDWGAYEDTTVYPYTPTYVELCNSSTDIQKEGHPNDDEGHGTFVASVIAGTVDSGTNNPVGIASNVKIMPVKVLAWNGYGTLTAIANGIKYATSEGADVINLSLGGPANSVYTAALDYALSKDVVIVGATGNDGLASISYPAGYSGAYANVIAVGASNPDNSRSYYSNYGPNLDLVAPVGEVESSGNAPMGTTFSADFTGTTIEDRAIANDFKGFTNLYWTGTSFAAPQVAAAAAIIRSKDDSLTAPEIKQILRNNTTQVTDGTCDTEDTDSLGCGVLDLKKSWDAVPKVSYFTDWTLNMGMSPENINVIEFNSKLYQVTRDVNRYIYMRDSSDGITWSAWTQSGGQTPMEVTMITFNSKIYQTTVDVNRNIYMRDSSDGTTWSAWTMQNGMSPENINMAVFDPDAGGAEPQTLYQVTRDVNRYIYMRRSTDGTTWTTWQKTGGQTPAEVNMEVFGGKMHQVTRDVNRFIFTRNSTDGQNWTPWVQGGGQTPDDITMKVFDNTLLQFTRNVTNYIYMRYSSDGTTWSDWKKTGGQTPAEVNMEAFNNKLNQVTINVNRNIFTREYTRY